MSKTFQKKSNEVKNFFNSLPSLEERYSAIIEMGRELPPLSQHLKIEENLVPGCQSKLFLASGFENGLIHFDASSDALISAGLAALLIRVYSYEAPETILKLPPTFISEIGLQQTLSPSRSNGLAQIHLRMKKDALKYLLVLS